MLQRKIFIAVTTAWLCLSLVSAAQLTSVTHTFQTGSGGKLVVDLDSGDIQIQTGASQVMMEVVGIEESDLPDLEYSEEAGTVRVSYDPSGWGSSARFEFTVPTTFDLDLETAGGDITLEDPLAGNIRASTSGGDIRTQDVDGEVTLKTAGGDIETGAVSGNVSLKTAGGDITLASAEGEVDAKTAGGDIEVGDVQQRLVAKTAGGDITLGNVGGFVEAKTAGGDVMVHEVGGSAELTTAGGDIELDSATGSVIAKTAGGDLDLRGVRGSLTGKTSGGDIYSEVLAGSDFGDSELQTAGGDIEVYLPAGAGVTVVARIRISGNWERESSEYTIAGDLVTAPPTVNPSSKEISATLDVGGGGPTLRLETVNGNIWIRSLAQ